MFFSEGLVPEVPGKGLSPRDSDQLRTLLYHLPGQVSLEAGLRPRLSPWGQSHSKRKRKKVLFTLNPTIQKHNCVLFHTSLFPQHGAYRYFPLIVWLNSCLFGPVQTILVQKGSLQDAGGGGAAGLQVPPSHRPPLTCEGCWGHGSS